MRNKNLLSAAIHTITGALIGLVIALLLNGCEITEPVHELSLSGTWTSYDIDGIVEFKLDGPSAAEIQYLYNDGTFAIYDGTIRKTGFQEYEFYVNFEYRKIVLISTSYAGGKMVMTNGDELQFMKLIGDQ